MAQRIRLDRRTVHPGSARAQTTANLFEELQRILKEEDIVIVTDKAGQDIREKVAEVSASSLLLLIPTKAGGGDEIWTASVNRTIAGDSIAEIRRSDGTGQRGDKCIWPPHGCSRICSGF